VNIVKFYHRDTGKEKRVRIVQRLVGRKTPQAIRKWYPLQITEAMMAHAGYFRQKPRAGIK